MLQCFGKVVLTWYVHCFGEFGAQGRRAGRQLEFR